MACPVCEREQCRSATCNAILLEARATQGEDESLEQAIDRAAKS